MSINSAKLYRTLPEDTGLGLVLIQGRLDIRGMVVRFPVLIDISLLGCVQTDFKVHTALH